MPKWNAQQKKAIETKQKNILVSASAGSGKTTVLIARLMDLVMKDHISIDEICALLLEFFVSALHFILIFLDIASRSA